MSMANKFKVGDKVRINEKYYFGKYYFGDAFGEHVGDEAIVVDYQASRFGGAEGYIIENPAFHSSNGVGKLWIAPKFLDRVV